LKSENEREPDSDPLRTREEAAAQLRMSMRTFDRLGLPTVHVTPKLVRIRQSVIDRYKVEHEK
jgi:hypothetical protein